MKILAYSFVAACCLAPAAHAATVLADFDGTQDGFLSANMGTDSIGSGVCADFTGASSTALCGNNLRDVAPTPDTLTFASVDFDTALRISFDLAATATGGGDLDNDPTGTNQDFIRVSAIIGSSPTILAEWRGIDGTATMDLFLGSATGPALVDSSFDSYSTLSTVTGTGDLEFAFRTTGSNEILGIDNIALHPVPLPPGLALIVAALGALGLAGRRRRA